MTIGISTGSAINNMLNKLRMSIRISDYSDDELLQKIEELITLEVDYKNVSIAEKAAIMDGVFSKVRGYDILDPLIKDDRVTEIMVNSHKDIFYEKEGRLLKYENSFESHKNYFNLIQKIVSEVGKEVNLRKPICDCRMKDGSRVNVVLDPISDGSPTLTIRKFRRKIFSLDELVKKDTLSVECSDFLKSAVKAGLNIFVCGGTGSGKTTMLNALSNEIPNDERIITIEDARELNFQSRENWVALEARSANARGEGEVTIRDLIRASLRMRPDRIIVGEVRGGEAIDMLQAMNTGHDGSLSTGHSNSIPDMQYRLETMVLSSSRGLPIQAVRQQIGAAIDIFVYLSRMSDHSRKLVEIDEVLLEEKGLSYNCIFKRTYVKAGSKLLATGRKLKKKEKFIRAGINSDFV